ncbi:glyoxylase-like metal-dependent hydrolase (beta-lactamase superfamily II) [Amycolatopsis bartoniae]|uniref:MBL fold metallo-hydrolase n=1 Tax=Amycolatopsis bartoniae TaxID=941986 RepID=A0A8H9ITK2_9PSEU|nr:MBL fold metallo-hydrolase [Amycolatopsis bartoniae]MBB2937720.1 glyoxylase-like metal-dependent hydrolase (beta-lactamase superfamily II) [Amycolatopsis bartoniae]TVT08196.1 MBL fold metallo-hydrolase [Amycolatopsis bartoniae]GHF40184.1 MBL fold metallo-hydrolase [Amycolatopsis bartoniae]
MAVREIAKNVHLAQGTDVNWVLVRDGDDVTLIDGGWPGDAGAVAESVREIGCRPEGIRAILLTHAHLDHLGALNPLHERYGVPVYTHPVEVAHARRERLEQASPLDVLKQTVRPGGLGWAARIVRAGALTHPSVPFAQPFPAEGALDLPGHPVPVLCAGHTSGHTAYLLPDQGVAATGDALVTAHPLSRLSGPQLLPEFFAHDPAQVRETLDALGALEADIVAPGHGEPWLGPLADAVAIARRR